MTAVLMTPPYAYFTDANGDPLSGGKIETFTAGTTAPKATFTDQGAGTPNANPVILDSSGLADIWLDGAYKIVVKDSADNVIRTVDNISSFTTGAEAISPFFQSFSGDGVETDFTLTEDVGTDSENLMIYVDDGLQEHVTNGAFAADTDWTKGAGWTIAAGVATATGAISTALSQTSAVTLIEGQAYNLTYTVTRSAGGIIPSLGGGNDGVERVAGGTFTEVLIAGATQLTAFTGNSFTGTLDDIKITPAVSKGRDILNPNQYTVNGTALSLSVAPADGTNNILVFAPSLLLGAASSSAAAALTSEQNAAADAVSTAADVVLTGNDVVFTNADVVLTGNDVVSTAADVVSTGNDVTAAAASAQDAEDISTAIANKWLFDTSIVMADPGTGDLRLNNATPTSVTQIAVSALTAETGNPDVSAFVATWDDSTNSTLRGTITIRKGGDPATFAIYSVTGAITDNGTWLQIPVSHVDGAGTFSASDDMFTGFARTGNQGGGLADVVDDTSPQLGGFLDPNGNFIGWDKGSDIASASPLVINTDGNMFDVTGTTGFSAFTVAANRSGILQFDDALIITVGAGITLNNAGGNYTTATGDIMVWQSIAANTVIGWILKIDGKALSKITVSDLADATDGELITWDSSGVAATVAVGTALQVLTSNGVGAAPTFQTAGGGDVVKIAALTASASSSLDFNSAIDNTTFSSYFLVLDKITPASSATLHLLLSDDNGVGHLSDYDRNVETFAVGSSTTFTYAASTAGAEIVITAGTDAVEPGNSGTIWFTGLDGGSNTLDSALIKWETTIAGTGAENKLIKGWAKTGSSTTEINALRLIYSTGNIASGTATLYGVTR